MLLLLTAAGAALAVIAAGCGGSKSTGVASLGPGTVAASTQPTTTGRDAAGLPDGDARLRQVPPREGFEVPDPTFGRAVAVAALRAVDDRNDPKFQKAQDEVPPEPGGGAAAVLPGHQQQFQDAALEFAQCMRKNGVDVPDPDFSGGGGPAEAASSAAATSTRTTRRSQAAHSDLPLGVHRRGPRRAGPPRGQAAGRRVEPRRP